MNLLPRIYIKLSYGDRICYRTGIEHMWFTNGPQHIRIKNWNKPDKLIMRHMRNIISNSYIETIINTKQLASSSIFYLLHMSGRINPLDMLENYLCSLSLLWTFILSNDTFKMELTFCDSYSYSNVNSFCN